MLLHFGWKAAMGILIASLLYWFLFRKEFEALRAARVPGDRFALAIAGPRGGLVLTPNDFRQGPIDLLLNRLIDTPVPGAAVVTLPDVMRSSIEHLRATTGDAEAVNSGLLLIATDRSSLDELDALETLAFEGALGGITTSVVSTNGALELGELDRLVLAGQGRRRVLSGPERAAEVVERELHAQAGVVARALRLNIRFAPHVKLLEVLGSARIDPAAVQRTRRIEQHIDRTIAAQLGIAADRDADDEGIQILIPSFYADDSHVILLDVLAERPGPVAEVSVRYKDLVFLRNGIAREQLRVPRVRRPQDRWSATCRKTSSPSTCPPPRGRRAGSSPTVRRMRRGSPWRKCAICLPAWAG